MAKRERIDVRTGWDRNMEGCAKFGCVVATLLFFGPVVLFVMFAGGIQDRPKTPNPPPVQTKEPSIPQANIIGEIPAELPEEPAPAPKPLRFTDQDPRAWKSEDGNFEIEATLTGFDPVAQTAALQKPDGKFITVELKKLSLEDRNHIRNAAKNE